MRIWRRSEKLEGKRVLITGASSGIGLALSRVLVGRKAKLVMWSRDPARLEAAAEAVGREHPASPAPLPRACDVTTADAVRGLLEVYAARLREK